MTVMALMTKRQGQNNTDATATTATTVATGIGLSALVALTACASAPKVDPARIHEVGRVNVVVDSPQWKALAMPEATREVRVASGQFDNSPVKGARKVLYVNDPAGATQVVLDVRTTPGASAGGRGFVTDFRCTAEGSQVYVNDLSQGNKRRPTCVRVWNQVSGKGVVNGFPGPLKQAVLDGAVRLDERSRMVMVATMNSNAAWVTVQAVVRSDFTGGNGLADAPGAPVPQGMDPAFAAWADALGQAAAEAATSIHGELQVPPWQIKTGS